MFVFGDILVRNGDEVGALVKRCQNGNTGSSHGLNQASNLVQSGSFMALMASTKIRSGLNFKTREKSRGMGLPRSRCLHKTTPNLYRPK